MTDDTKALAERLRWVDPSGVYIAGLDTRDRDKLAAADTIERLQRELAEAHQIERSDGEIRRELDAKLAEIESENERLRRALRDAAVIQHPSPYFRDECLTCGETWGRLEPERHVTGCLAAPKDAP